jgi:spore coat polysaccharide biosynthesis protein SpsF
MGSTRLRGKVLKKIGDKTIIEHIVKRVKKCNKLDEVIVATSLSEENKDLINLLSKKNIKVFLGSENDVLDRYIKAGQYYNADILVRVTGDNPLTCPNCIDKMLTSHLKNEAQYTAMKNLPIGIGSEIVNLNTLLEIQYMDLLDYHREHVTLYIRENEANFRINILRAPIELAAPGVRLTVDTNEDFTVLKELYSALHRDNGIIEVSEVLRFLKNNKETLVNRNIVQRKR